MNRCPTLSYVHYVWTDLVSMVLLRGGAVEVELAPVTLNEHLGVIFETYEEALKALAH